jgi:hypothetical protein
LTGAKKSGMMASPCQKSGEPACIVESHLRRKMTRTAAPTRHFKLHKRSQLFLRVHNETLSIAAMCVCNEECSPLRIRD